MQTPQSKMPDTLFPQAKSQTPISEQAPLRALRSTCLAHAVHDGMTDLIYVLLPIWQTQFAISYAMAGLMRGLYSGVMAGLQIKASGLSKRFGRRALLVIGTALAGSGYLLAGQAGGVLAYARHWRSAAWARARSIRWPLRWWPTPTRDPLREKRWRATIFRGISARCWCRPWSAYRSAGLAGDKA